MPECNKKEAIQQIIAIKPATLRVDMQYLRRYNPKNLLLLKEIPFSGTIPDGNGRLLGAVMMPGAEIAGAEEAAGRFRKGQSGNPSGRPKGARNRATLAMEALLDGEADAIGRKAIEMALDGDPIALRLVMERVLPPRRERPITFRLPKLETAEDAPKAASALVNAVANGSLTPSEAVDLSRLIDSFIKALDVNDLEKRITALEARR